MARIEIQSDLYDYTDVTRQPSTPLYDVFSALAIRRAAPEEDPRPVWIHRARTASLNDLAVNALGFHRTLRKEVQAKINGSQHIFPKLYDSFLDVGHQTLVTKRYPSYYTIEEILTEYPEGVDSATIAWMANRMFEAVFILGLVGVFNGAILPPHVRFFFGTESDEQRHTMRIDEWSVAGRISDDGDFSRLTGKFDGFDDIYPPELPAMPTKSTDLAMGARCILRLADAELPLPMRHMLEMAAAETVAGRPRDVLTFMKQFRLMQERNFGSAKFHYLPMPRGAGRSN